MTTSLLEMNQKWNLLYFSGLLENVAVLNLTVSCFFNKLRKSLYTSKMNIWICHACVIYILLLIWQHNEITEFISNSTLVDKHFCSSTSQNICLERKKMLWVQVSTFLFQWIAYFKKGYYLFLILWISFHHKYWICLKQRLGFCLT